MNIRLPEISINSTPLNRTYSYIIYINIYRGATLALNPSNASNSTSGAVKFPQMRQMRQMRQMVI